ncbi:MAG: CBS domain-containing protein, partial [Dehalococcoidia bacterium]
KSLNVITVRPDQSLKDAVDLLVEHDIGALVVVDEPGEPVGVISERDIIREAARTETVLAQTVDRVMTTDLVVASPEDDIGAVLETMVAGRFRHLPIVDQERLVGVISIRDVLKVQLDAYQGEVDTLQTQIIEGQA